MQRFQRDEEVLERMSRPQMIYTYDADVVLRNVRALGDMRDEALRFGHDDQPAGE